MLALALVAISVGFSNLAASIGIGVGGVTAATRIRVLAIFGLFEAGMPIVGLIIGQNLASDVGSKAKWIGAVLLVGVGVYGIAGFVRSGGISSIARSLRPAPARPDRPAPDQPVPGRPVPDHPVPGQPVRDHPVPGQPVRDHPVPDQPVHDQPVAGRAEVRAGAQPPVLAQATRTPRQEWLKIGISGLALSLDNLIAGFALGGYQVNLLIGAVIFGVVSIGMSLAGLEFGSKLSGWAGDSGELIGGIVLIGVGTAIGLGVLG